jgi:hypothetical protein
VEQTTAPDEPAVIAPARARRRRAWRLVLLVGVAVISAYVVFGAPGQGFPGRAGIAELHRVESEINRAYAECGVDHRATINWFWGSV